MHALIANEWQAQIARFEINGGKPPTFAATSRRGFLRVARGLARRIMAPAPPAPCDVVLVTLGDSVANGAPDAYFGELAGTLRQRCSVTTVYVAPGKRLRFPERSDAVPLEAFLHLTDALATCAVAQTSFTGIEASPADQALIAYLRAREHTSGEVAMQRVMALAFDRMFERLKPKTVVYPFENRSWEKNLLKAARRNKVARCVGYQHSSLTPRHLAFSDCSEGSGMSPLPDAILTCGEITAERIRAEAPLLRARVTVGAALRTKRLPVNAPNRAGVLAAISSSRAEAWEMLRALHALSGRTDMPVIVRTHPTIPIEDLYRQFTWPDHVQLSRGRSLAADFQDTSLVLYSSSTVAVEGMLYGRLPIYLDIGDVPSGNPISGEHAFVFRASGADTLEEVILGIGALNDDDLEALRAQARTYAQRYLVEPTAANVDRMAELIARC